ncbi:P-II family nitrogen regulator [Anaerosporobacter sp.]|uniref:P-II family nitrogen regulator n=1 Tax=Anaerosporobacter sp. TaxID=1872529 RepID=UPI00286F2B50|nr:P-II family nitrogen regulator [Anaerosporobacter sp.]
MKEVLIIVRQDKVSKTKVALTEAGILGFTCRKVMGRGKKLFSPELYSVLEAGEMPANSIGECFTEGSRLIPKRLFVIMAQDEDVEKIVTAVMEVNSTGTPGDGKIFVMPIMGAYRIRDGKQQEGSDSY